MDWLDRKHQKTTWNHWSTHEMKGSLVSFFDTITVTSQYQKYGNHWGYLSASMSKIKNWASKISAFQSPPDRWSSWKKAHWPCNIFLLGVYSPLRSKLAMRDSDLPRLCYICKSPYGTFFCSLSLPLSIIHSELLFSTRAAWYNEHAQQFASTVLEIFHN